MGKRRFWYLYIAAWLPYALSYYVLFRGYGTEPLVQTAYNILPAMLAGVLVVRWCRFLHWKLHNRWWFYPAQLGSALAYSLLWSVGVVMLGSIGNAMVTHHFTFGFFNGYALQWQFFSGLMIYSNIVGVGYVFQTNASLAIAEHRREQAEALQTAAQLSALRAQLNPHFLFNTLNSIAALAGPSQPQTLEAISELAAMLRYTLCHADAKEEVTLREELSFTDRYLALEQLRMGSRLRVIREVQSEALRCVLPPLTLQPLVENAIRHGIAPKATGGTLCMRACIEGSDLLLSVEDDGIGADLCEVQQADGLGLSLVRKRLSLGCFDTPVFALETQPGKGFRVAIKIPQDSLPKPSVLKNVTLEEAR